MSRPRGGYIGFDRVPAASGINSAASGVWTLREAEALKRGGTWPTAPAAFLPTDAAGLQLWLDAADSATLFDATSGGSAVAADGGVARWEDKSGNGRHATQGTSANRPARKTAIQGGKDVLRFDGSNDTLGFPTNFRWWPQGTLCAVLANASASNFWYSAREGNDNPEIRLRISTGSGYWYYLDAYYLNDVAGHYDAIGSGSVRTVTIQNTFYKSYSNGSLKNSTTLAAAVSSNNPASEHTIGGFVALSNYATVDICELIIYNSALSDADRQAVESYLMTKWGIT